MRSSAEYLEKLAGMRNNVYLDGKASSRTDSRVIRGSKVIQMTFDLVDDPQFEGLLKCKSHLNGETINRFTAIHRCQEDLLLKQEMTRKLCRLTGGCIQRCMGCDAMNALGVTTRNIDDKYQTDYHQRWFKYLEYFQKNDLVAACAQTDAKGDRRLRPGEQPDPDQYLHVVERRPDGVVVKGAKLHNTMAPYADEIIALPTRLLGKTERDYAIAFAIPADSPGLYLIGREGSYLSREPGMEAPISEFGDVESFTVFDRVFVPNERIFLDGQTEFAGELAQLFALYHRHSYCGCKAGMADIIMGTTALVADYLGIEKMGHIKEKLAELISVAELVYAAGIASAVKSFKAPSGSQIPDIIYANTGRRLAGHNIYHEYQILCEIAGGLPITLPLSKQYNSPEIGHFIKKYVSRREGVSPENHYRAAHLASDVLASEMAVALQIAGVHGGGSPIMEDIAILSSYDLQEKKNLAKHLAGIKEED
ncbi:MAG: aromatic ring hydroxylase [Syntrophomonadaceae bacterium]|nr:aromatic ring hydroxylase [Syntrophomonadaceae bacterium]